MTYLHHIANCTQSRAKPLTYTQWLSLTNSL